jgi:hypothetical protein
MRKVAAFLALCALALPTSAAASASFPTAVAVNVPAFAKSNFAHVIPSGMVVSPPPAGCAREHPGAVKLTLALGGHSSTGLVTPCQELTSLPDLSGLMLRIEPRPSSQAQGMDIALIPQLVRKNFSRTFVLSATFDGRTLIRKRVHLAMIWAPAQRIWQNTDQFVNYCIDKLHPVYSSGLRLYCNIPSVLQGSVTVTS